MTNKFLRPLLIILFVFTTIKLYSQEGPAGTTTITGKLVEARELIDYNDNGNKLFFAIIENSKKEKVEIVIIKDTKILSGKTEVNFESIKLGSNLTIEYKLGLRNSNTAIWVYTDNEKDEKKDADTTESKEENKEQSPVPADDKEEDKGE